MTPARDLSSVVLPDPASPMMATKSPGGISSDAASRMRLPPATSIVTISAARRSEPRSSRATRRAPSKMRRRGPRPIVPNRDDLGVEARPVGVVEHDIVGGVPADGELVPQQADGLGGAGTLAGLGGGFAEDGGLPRQ